MTRLLLASARLVADGLSLTRLSESSWFIPWCVEVGSSITYGCLVMLSSTCWSRGVDSLSLPYLVFSAVGLAVFITATLRKF